MTDDLAVSIHTGMTAVAAMHMALNRREWVHLGKDAKSYQDAFAYIYGYLQRWGMAAVDEEALQDLRQLEIKQRRLMREFSRCMTTTREGVEQLDQAVRRLQGTNSNQR